MKAEEEKVKQGLKKVGQSIKENTKKVLPDIAQTLIHTGKLPREVFKISDGKIEEMYSQAYHLYNTGKYKQAIQLFRLLILINADNPKYVMGVAACFHMMKEYKNAVESYTFCAILEPENPIPLFHASDCFIQSGDKFSALVALEMAVKKAGNSPQYQVLKDRALMTIEGLRKDLPEQK